MPLICRHQPPPCVDHSISESGQATVGQPPIPKRVATICDCVDDTRLETLADSVGPVAARLVFAVRLKANILAQQCYGFSYLRVSDLLNYLSVGGAGT